MTEGFKKGGKKGRRSQQRKVGQTGRQWRMLQLDTTD